METLLPLTHHFVGDSRKPVIVFLHGFMGSGDDWQEVVASLKENYYCMMIDFPGHGPGARQDGTPSWTMENTAGAVISTLKAAHLRTPCFLTGYSMGGRVALFLAIHYPQYFNGVVLESASPGLKTAEERQLRVAHDELLAERLEKEDFAAFLRFWYAQPLFQSVTERADFPQLLRKRMNNNPKALARSLREMGTGRQPSLWERLSSVKIPLLLIVGEKDSKFRAIAEEMIQRNSTLRMKIFPGCGHNVHLENPQKFSKVLHDFFASLYIPV